MSSPTNVSLLAVVAIIALVGLGGLAGTQPVHLGDGTATVDVVSMPGEQLAFEAGRFGTAADYLRLPNLSLEVKAVSGTPRILYSITVSGMGVDRQETRLIQRQGRLRVQLADVAFPPKNGPEPGTYNGRMVVRVQSFSTDTVVVNRSVRIRVPE